MKFTRDLLTLGTHEFIMKTGNGFYREEDSHVPEFGTPESDNYDTSIETLRILIKAIHIEEDSIGYAPYIWDPYYNTGLVGEYWDELGYLIHHKPHDFFRDENIPLEGCDPTIQGDFTGQDDAHILITK